jgi:hypothetical protein
MRKSILIISLFLISISLYSQEFKYYGGVFNSNEVGISNIPVKLYSKRTSVYDITFPTYPVSPSYNIGIIVPSSDDVTHGPFPIGFTFNYFGVNYTQFYIGSNGWIGFSPGQTTGYTAMFVPNASSPVNSILGDWEDLLPGSSNIYYSTTGTIPNRKLTGKDLWGFADMLYDTIGDLEHRFIEEFKIVKIGDKTELQVFFGS